MKPLAVAGVVLIVLGALALVYQGVSYRSRDTILDMGPMHATVEHDKTLPLPPILGIGAVVGGVLLLVLGARKGA